MELKIGQKVWVKSTLESGFMIEEKIMDMVKGFRGYVYYISDKGLRFPYEERDLVSDEGEASLICQEALEFNKRQAEKRLADFLRNCGNKPSFEKRAPYLGQPSNFSWPGSAD